MIATGALGGVFPLADDRPVHPAERWGAGFTRARAHRCCTEGLLRRPIKGVYLAHPGRATP